MSEPVSWVGQRWQEIVSGWRQGITRGGKMTKHVVEGACGRSGAPCRWEVRRLEMREAIATTRCPPGVVFTCISCAREGLTDYVPCSNASHLPNPVEHGSLCGPCAVDWCVVYNATDCPSCRNPRYRAENIRLNVYMRRLGWGNNLWREIPRLLGFLGLEGAKEKLTSLYATFAQGAAKKALETIERLGVVKYMEQHGIGGMGLLGFYDWLQRTQLVASSKVAAVLHAMPIAAVAEIGACLALFVLLEVYQMVNGRDEDLACMEAAMRQKLPYVLIAEVAFGAGMVTEVGHLLLRCGLVIPAQGVYWLWRATVVSTKWLWCQETEHTWGDDDPNVLGQPEGWSLVGLLQHRWREWWGDNRALPHAPADDDQAAPADDADDGDDDDDDDGRGGEPPALTDDPDRALLAEAAQSRCGCPSA